jgi:hypothetical protein
LGEGHGNAYGIRDFLVFKEERPDPHGGHTARGNDVIEGRRDKGDGEKSPKGNVMVGHLENHAEGKPQEKIRPAHAKQGEEKGKNFQMMDHL